MLHFYGRCLTLCLLIAALGGGCRAPEPRTQVMLIIDADSEVQALASELYVEIESRSEFDHIDGAPTSQTINPMEESAATWPFSIALVPQGRDARRSYRIVVTLSDADEAIARLRAHSGFVAHQTLELRMRFSADCLRAASLNCRDQETCFAGKCVSAQLDAQDLLPLSGGIANGFSPGDASVSSWSSMSSSREPAVTTGSSAGGAAAAAGSGGTGNPSKPGSDNPKPGETSGPGNCGDGKKDDGEHCDTAIPAGEPGACPSACVAEDACHPSQLEGSGCLTQCKPYPITTTESGDGCCPAGADSNSDADCAARCGNSIIEAGETCDPAETCPSAMTCQSANVCLRATIAGDAASCTATCTMQPIEECMSGDGCCPSACANDTDNDCSASCGNGVVDVNAGELCEPMSTTQACPTSCNDMNACTADFFTGSARNCNLACTSVPTLVPLTGDGCCPPGANANNDRDCPAVCGNLIVEPGERCDGRCPTQSDCVDTNPCTRDALAGTDCGVMCTHTLINAAASGDGCCPAGANATNDGDCQPSCGNGVIELGELCDGRCPTSASCNDGDSCTTDEVVGEGCQRSCVNRPMPASGNVRDGCCPNGANLNTDADCAGCGNGRLDPGELCDPCDDPCTDTDPCTDDKQTGSGCNVECKHERKMTSPSGDGCCLNGPSFDDTDCEPPDPMCGNGRVESGEDCDGVPPAVGACPPCEDADPCVETRRAMPCKAACATSMKDPSGPRVDGCCPRGANKNTDTDCEAMCGNEAVEPGEMCDPCPACVDTDPCTREVETGTGCNRNCEHVPITAPDSGDMCCPQGANANNDSDCRPRCGNGEIEGNEECDEVSTTCDGCRKVMP